MGRERRGEGRRRRGRRRHGSGCRRVAAGGTSAGSAAPRRRRGALVFVVDVEPGSPAIASISTNCCWKKPSTPPVSPSRRRRMIASGPSSRWIRGTAPRRSVRGRRSAAHRRCRRAEPAAERSASRPGCSCVDHADRFDVDARCDLVIRADREVRLGLCDQAAQVAADPRRAEQQVPERAPSAVAWSTCACRAATIACARGGSMARYSPSVVWVIEVETSCSIAGSRVMACRRKCSSRWER